MTYNNLFQENLIEIDTYYESKNEIFKNVSSYLYQNQYTEETFLKALIEREEIYPTGLSLEHVNIAIPHTDVKHIKKPFVYLIRLKEPCEFIQMGTTDEMIKSKVVMILGIKEPHKQVGMLALLMEIYSDGDFCQAILEAETNEQIKYLINQRMGEESHEKSYRSVR